MSESEGNLNDRYEAALGVLGARGQAHVLGFWDELAHEQRAHLLGEIEAIPWDVLDPVIESHVRRKPERVIPGNIEPARVWPAHPGTRQGEYDRARERGRSLIREGKVAAFTVAGGQGTRLGFDGPKGAFPVTPVKNKSLFQLFAEMILAARGHYATAIPWYIMTSPANHEQTGSFLRAHDYFGMPESDVQLFPQGMLPAFDFEGRLLLEDKHRLALAPDGHGGSLKALVSSGALNNMRRRGVEIISYFQVDNPLVKPFDPLFIGLHAEHESEMSLKVTRKREDLEHVGNLCQIDGKLAIVEYMEFPDELAHLKCADGHRLFDAANLGIHLLNPNFVERVCGSGGMLPFRRAERKVRYIDDTGYAVDPETPNAVKLEMFVFDALRFAQRTLALEVLREEEFSPVKNATGNDSIETAQRDLIEAACKHLEHLGLSVPCDADGHRLPTVEISPLNQLHFSSTELSRLREQLSTARPCLYIA